MNKIDWLIIPAVVVLISIASVSAACAPNDHPAAPDFTLKDLNGNEISLSDYEGKVLFLNFWATWCAACVVEMPSMENLNGRLKDRDFVMVAINTQESDTQVKAFFEKMKLSFTALLDSNGEVAAGFAVNALPTTFVLDKDGRIVGTAIGPREWDSRASIDLFEYLIDIRPEVKRET